MTSRDARGVFRGLVSAGLRARSAESSEVEYPKFSVHRTRRIADDEPIASSITFEALSGARFAKPAPRTVREDERLYVNGAFTLGELERIVSWARGGRS